jgi:hypothetical protein
VGFNDNNTSYTRGKGIEPKVEFHGETDVVWGPTNNPNYPKTGYIREHLELTYKNFGEALVHILDYPDMIPSRAQSAYEQAGYDQDLYDKYSSLFVNENEQDQFIDNGSEVFRQTIEISMGFDSIGASQTFYSRNFQTLEKEITAHAVPFDDERHSVLRGYLIDFNNRVASTLLSDYEREALYLLSFNKWEVVLYYQNTRFKEQVVAYLSEYISKDIAPGFWSRFYNGIGEAYDQYGTQFWACMGSGNPVGYVAGAAHGGWIIGCGLREGLYGP